ncbi:MAG TPA: sialidase family protein [Verrucomicrobiota bacterium]|nr:sialidase family protein [Verrucomicrobiota bacterium]
MNRITIPLAVGIAAALPLLAGEVRLERVPEQGLQPAAVTDARGRVHLIYLAGDPKSADIHYTTRSQPTLPWSKPIVVNSQPGSAIAIGTVRGPRLALGENGRALVVWNGSSMAEAKADESAPLLFSRLSDDGASFETQRNLLGGTTRHLDGGAAVASNQKGLVWAVWHGAPKTPPPEGDSETARGVYLAASSDDGKTFSEPRRIDTPHLGVCACCGLEAGFHGPQHASILYRSAENGNERGMVWLRSHDDGRSFSSQRLDRWNLSECPMTTTRFVPGAPFAVWSRQGTIQLGHLGENPSPRVTAVSGLGQRANHPVAVQSTDGQMLVVWTEGTGWQRGGTLAWKVTKAGSAAEGRIKHVPGVPIWGLPAAAQESDGGFTIWY